MITTKATTTAAKAAPEPTRTRPLYMVLCCRGETYAEPIRHNPIGVTGDIYLHPNGALCLWDTSIGGQLPLNTLPRGTEVILHLLGGMEGKYMAVDAARLLSEQYKQSAAALVRQMRESGLKPIVYAGHPNLALSTESCLAAIEGWGEWCIEVGTGLIFDSSATLTDTPIGQAVKRVFMALRNANRPTGMEGIASTWACAELAPLVTHHFLEMQSVVRSFTDGWDDNPEAVPDVAKVVVWDKDGQRSNRQEMERLSRESLLGGFRSAIGAHTWRFHTTGGPRMILSGGSNEVRDILAGGAK